MRIGINALSITRDSTGGGTTYILEIVEHLSQIDHSNNYTLFVRDDSRHHFGVYGSNFRFVSVPMIPLLSVAFRVLVEQIVLPALAIWYRLDVLLCTDALPFWVPCASVMIIQNLIYFHQREVSPLTHITKGRFHHRAQILYYKLLTSRSALRADRVITVSENAKREIVDFLKIDSSKVSVVHHGVGKIFSEDMDGRHDFGSVNAYHNSYSNYLLYVGAILPYKNIEGAIAAFSVLKARCSASQNSPLSLVIAGADHSGYASHVRNIVDRLGISEYVIFLGHVPYEKLPPLYRGAKALVFLSLCESFGLPILEAMACGCPVVCSNVSSLPEIAGNAAVLVDPEDPLKVADAIEALLDDEQNRRHMIAMGRSRANEFPWIRAASQTLSAIDQAAKNRHSRAKGWAGSTSGKGL